MRKVSFLLSITFVFFSVSICLAQGSKPRRVTTTSKAKPKPTPTPKAEELSIISTAEDEATDTTETQPAKKPTKRTSQPQSEQEYMRGTMNGLSTDIGTLSERVGQMEEKQRQLINLQILSQAEARAETLHQQLFDTMTKEADLKGRLMQLEYEGRSEIIERSMSGIGSTRPEDLREARRQQINAEKQRIQDQITLIQQNRARLEAGVNSADQLVERLRRSLEEMLDNPQTKTVPKPKEKTDTDKPEQDNPDN